MGLKVSLTVATIHGDAVATRVRHDQGRDYEWQIAFPWSDRTYFGTEKQVRDLMAKEIAEVEQADAEDLQDAA